MYLVVIALIILLFSGMSFRQAGGKDLFDAVEENWYAKGSGIGEEDGNKKRYAI